jgi:hypothetical protein
MLLALFTLVGEWSGSCYGCLEEERVGLLEIQSLIDPDKVMEIEWPKCCINRTSMVAQRHITNNNILRSSS